MAGILHVYAGDTTDESTRSHITISNDKSRLTSGEIDQMILMAKLFQTEDRAQEQLICAKQSLQAYAAVVRNTVATDASALLDATEKARVSDQMREVDAWLASREAAAAAATDAETDGETSPDVEPATAADFEAKQAELEAVCQPILRKLFASGAGTGEAAEPQLQAVLSEALQQLQQQRLQQQATTVE